MNKTTLQRFFKNYFDAEKQHNDALLTFNKVFYDAVDNSISDAFYNMQKASLDLLFDSCVFNNDKKISDKVLKKHKEEFNDIVEAFFDEFAFELNYDILNLPKPDAKLPDTDKELVMRSKDDVDNQVYIWDKDGNPLVWDFDSFVDYIYDTYFTEEEDKSIKYYFETNAFDCNDRLIETTCNFKNIEITVLIENYMNNKVDSIIITNKDNNQYLKVKPQDNIFSATYSNQLNSDKK